MDISGQAAIVTGGGSGLGAATARLLAAQGAKVAVLDVNEDGAAGVAEEIGGIALACDVADGESAENAVATAREAHGPARILVCCAGIAPGKLIAGRDGPMPLEAFRLAIDVNLIGTFNLLRLVVAGLRKEEALEDGERGVVICTASIAAFEGQIGQTAYAASKAGVAGLVLPAARELASLGIRVCAIAPGLFHTPMVEGLPEKVQEGLAADVPFPHRLGRPEEFASLVRHMIENRMFNGETVRLDAALRMKPG